MAILKAWFHMIWIKIDLVSIILNSLYVFIFLFPKYLYSIVKANVKSMFNNSTSYFRIFHAALSDDELKPIFVVDGPTIIENLL